MKLNTIKNIKNLRGKRVLIRLDLNVPLDKNGRVSKNGTWRLHRVVPTLKYLSRKGAKVIIMAHLGRPKGQFVEELSLLPVSVALGNMLKKDIEFWAEDFRDYVDDSHLIANGQIAMIENIRFEPREKKNCKRLAKSLSRLADIYVNDAFANIHRQDASMDAITNYLPSYAGLLVEEEIDYLSKVLEAKKGLVVMLGGAKIATKVKLIDRLSKNAEALLLGGALANTMLKAQGYNLGKSVVDDDELSLAKRLLKKNNIYLPLDLMTAKSLKASKSKKVDLDGMAKTDMALDLGPKTIKEYKEILSKAKLIVWNGPFGYFENKLFIKASANLMKYISGLKAKTIVGGGESVKLLDQLKLQDKMSFVSTGGGAMLAFLEGKKLPVLDKLKK